MKTGTPLERAVYQAVLELIDSEAGSARMNDNIEVALGRELTDDEQEQADAIVMRCLKLPWRKLAPVTSPR